jgi:hypothetical protein
MLNLWLAATVLVDAQSDPIKELVLRFLLSYGGIAGGVSFLVEGLKAMFKDKVTGREPVIVIVLAFVLGSAAKALVPAYGPNTMSSWGLHELILVFVAVGAAAFHDKFLSVLTSFMPKKTPPAGGDGGDQP